MFRWRCSNCGKIRYTIHKPDPKAGGNCSCSFFGNHSWKKD